MGAYSFRALDTGGQVVRGVLEGDSLRHARQQLRQRELRPLEVSAVPGEGAGRVSASWPWQRIGPRDLALLTRQLATLVESHMPLTDALAAIARQQRKPRLAALLIELRARIAGGHTLSYALGEYPRVFDGMYRAMVRAGESAGLLGSVLARVAEHAENRQFVAQKLRAATLYPLILILVAAAVVGALMHFVVPELVRIFATARVELPLLTRALLGVSGFLDSWGTHLLVGVLAGSLLLRRAWGQPAVRRRAQRAVLRLPIAGELVQGLEAERYCSALGILVGAGVPLLRALDIAAEVLRTEPFQRAALAARARVEQGVRLHRALEDTAVFPPMMVYLIASGEQGGELEAMLARAAHMQQRDTEMQIATLLALLEPLLVVLMGGFVLLIVLAVLMPVFDLNTLVR